MKDKKILEESTYCWECKKKTATILSFETGFSICDGCGRNKPVRRNELIVPFIREALIFLVLLILSAIGCYQIINWIFS